MHWLDVVEISEALVDEHPEIDPLTIAFPKLKSLVQSLPDFQEQSGHPSNEKILEAIQQAWIDELN